MFVAGNTATNIGHQRSPTNRNEDKFLGQLAVLKFYIQVVMAIIGGDAFISVNRKMLAINGAQNLI